MPDPDSEPPARPAPPEESSLLDRVQRWRGDPRVAALVVGLAVVAALVVWMRSTGGNDAPGGAAAGAVAGATTAPGAATTTTIATDAGPIVHVVGAVRSSGVVQLAAGARVRDAVVAAGGAADDADLQRLNLAAPVTDGQRIAVPRVGEPDPVPIPGAAAPTGETPSGPLPLNTATAEELETLPGIGPTLAEAIVRERERRGGFETIDDLKQVRGIGDARFADIRDLVTL